MKAARDVMLKHRLLLVTTFGSSGLEAAKPCTKASPLFYGSRGSRLTSGSREGSPRFRLALPNRLTACILQVLTGRRISIAQRNRKLGGIFMRIAIYLRISHAMKRAIWPRDSGG
jgi:hypothetical protein